MYLRLQVSQSLKRRAFLFTCGSVRGVIHIGANEGQERDLYAACGLDVVWIEPIPDVFQVLAPEHLTISEAAELLNYMVMDEDGKEYDFHVASNFGASSSILELSQAKVMWPEVSYTSTLTLPGFTLRTVLATEHINAKLFDALVLDTQGSEYRILSGSAELLSNFKFVKVEVADFEAYKGCCQIGELSSFMLSNGFREHLRIPFRHVPDVGTYFDVLYKRVAR